MSPRTGRPKIEDARDKLLQIRMNQEELDELDACAAQKKTSRAEVVREGIKLVKATLEEGQ